MYSYRYKHPHESEWSQGPNLRWNDIGKNTLKPKERSSKQSMLLRNQIYLPASGQLIHTLPFIISHLYYFLISSSVSFNQKKHPNYYHDQNIPELILFAFSHPLFLSSLSFLLFF